LGSFELGYVGGWKDCYAEADASNPLASFYTPLPQKSPVFIFSTIQFACLVLSACRCTKRQRDFIFHFSFFHFPQIPKSACTMALPHLTQRKLHEISISRNI